MLKKLGGTVIAAAMVSGFVIIVAPGAHAASNDVTVASYNVLKVNATGVPAWDQRQPRLPAIINNLNADVLSLQEVTNNTDSVSGKVQSAQVRDTLATLGYTTITPEENQCVRPRDAAGQLAGPSPCDTSATLAWRNEITVAPSVNGLPMTGLFLAGSIAPADAVSNARTVPWAFLQKPGGPVFLAISTHTSSDKDATAEAGRVAFAQALTGWAQNLATARGFDNAPMFIAGDLNSYKARQPAGAQAVLANAGWTDAYYAAPTRVGTQYATINVTPQTARYNGIPPKPFKYSKKAEPTRIDYVLSRNATPVAYETVVKLNANGTFNEAFRMSDHNAVVAKYVLGK